MARSKKSGQGSKQHSSLLFIELVVMGLAMSLALPGRASAADLTVNTTAQSPGAAGDCTLGEAITAANTNMNVDGCSGVGAYGNDVIILSTATYTLTVADNNTSPVGASGLPIVTSQITINGNSAMIERSSVMGTPDFRILHVAAGGNLTLHKATVQNGRAVAGSPIFADDGGGILNHGTLTLIDTTIQGNTGNFGGALRNGDGATLHVRQSTLSGNTTFFGGGLFNQGGTAHLSNCTVSGNQAHINGGGIENFEGAASVITITHCTIANNNANNRGGGILNSHGAMSGTTATITNSLIVSNTASSGNNCINDTGDIFLANGNNLATDGSCPGFLQVTVAQLNLGPLANNGGPTQTHALLSDGNGVSVAIDAGDQTECEANGITTDQRGVFRPADGNGDTLKVCDIGAFELAACASAMPSLGCQVNGKKNQPCVGTADHDLIIGTSGADVIFGLAGDDTLKGAAGADLLCGGSGADILIGGTGGDTLIGDTGDDVLKGEADDDELQGGEGNDTLIAGSGKDVLAGGSGNDKLLGNEGDDALDGGDGTDYLDGGEDTDSCVDGESLTRCE